MELNVGGTATPAIPWGAVVKPRKQRWTPWPSCLPGHTCILLLLPLFWLLPGPCTVLHRRAVKPVSKQKNFSEMGQLRLKLNVIGNLDSPHFLMVVFIIQNFCRQCAVIHPSSCGIHGKWLTNPSLWPFPASLKQDMGGKTDPLLMVKIFFKFKEAVTLKQSSGNGSLDQFPGVEASLHISRDYNQVRNQSMKIQMSSERKQFFMPGWNQTPWSPSTVLLL